MDPSIISESIVEAQREADQIIDDIENCEKDGSDRVDNENIILEVPKLLGNLNQEELVEMTRDLKSKNQQLDLLLLKAESYSHFIAENQKRSREMWAQAQDATENNLNTIASEASASVTPSNKKRRASNCGQTSSKAKKKLDVSTPSTSTTPENRSVSSDVLLQQPKSLVGGTLLDYQIEGMQWLLALWENGLSGILADEMGLGKTIQIIALIAYLREHNAPGPYLIAGPLATIPNWVQEFKKWLPSCPVLLYHGSKQDRETIRSKHMQLSKSKDLNFPIVITSFEICMIDKKYLERYTWQYLILDEGHRIKNKNCKLLRDLKSFKSISRLLLSGTPIQNTLDELWSLLNFCSPMIFDDLKIFQSWFGFRNIGKETKVDEILGTEQSQRIVTKLHEILRPFLLRRLKQDVLITMPPKREIVIYCAKTNLQNEYYENVLSNTIRESLISMGVEQAFTMSQLNMTMNLRKVCNHPFLFGEPKDPKTGKYLTATDPYWLILASGKFKVLDRILMQLKKNHGHKVLIFSQMTELLNILEDYCDYRDMKYCRFDGSTRMTDRQDAINSFNEDPNVFLFLISTRAGGLGINLTAADTVILFDSDWNPHQDSQAQDRCHRIGQTKPVVIYRLVTTFSIEINMLEKQVSKKKLERLTIQGGDYRKAGHRLGSGLTISKLRQLLEDDVMNLNRMTSEGDVNTETKIDDQDISEEELRMILDRERIFQTELSSPNSTTSLSTSTTMSSRSSTRSGDRLCPIPVEGAMYDIVLSDTFNILQALK